MGDIHSECRLSRYSADIEQIIGRFNANQRFEFQVLTEIQKSRILVADAKRHMRENQNNNRIPKPPSNYYYAKANRMSYMSYAKPTVNSANTLFEQTKFTKNQAAKPVKNQSIQTEGKQVRQVDVDQLKNLMVESVMKIQSPSIRGVSDFLCTCLAEIDSIVRQNRVSRNDFQSCHENRGLFEDLVKATHILLPVLEMCKKRLNDRHDVEPSNLDQSEHGVVEKIIDVVKSKPVERTNLASSNKEEFVFAHTEIMTQESADDYRTDKYDEVRSSLDTARKESNLENETQLTAEHHEEQLSDHLDIASLTEGDEQIRPQGIDGEFIPLNRVITIPNEGDVFRDRLASSSRSKDSLDETLFSSDIQFQRTIDWVAKLEASKPTQDDGQPTSVGDKELYQTVQKQEKCCIENRDGSLSSGSHNSEDECGNHQVKSCDHSMKMLNEVVGIKERDSQSHVGSRNIENACDHSYSVSHKSDNISMQTSSPAKSDACSNKYEDNLSRSAKFEETDKTPEEFSPCQKENYYDGYNADDDFWNIETGMEIVTVAKDHSEIKLLPAKHQDEDETRAGELQTLSQSQHELPVVKSIHVDEKNIPEPIENDFKPFTFEDKKVLNDGGNIDQSTPKDVSNASPLTVNDVLNDRKAEVACPMARVIHAVQDFEEQELSKEVEIQEPISNVLPTMPTTRSDSGSKSSANGEAMRENSKRQSSDETVEIPEEIMTCQSDDDGASDADDDFWNIETSTGNQDKEYVSPTNTHSGEEKKKCFSQPISQSQLPYVKGVPVAEEKGPKSLMFEVQKDFVDRKYTEQSTVNGTAYETSLDWIDVSKDSKATSPKQTEEIKENDLSTDTKSQEVKNTCDQPSTRSRSSSRFDAASIFSDSELRNEDSGEETDEIAEEIVPCIETNDGGSASDDDFWDLVIGTGNQNRTNRFEDEKACCDGDTIDTPNVNEISQNDVPNDSKSRFVCYTAQTIKNRGNTNDTATTDDGLPQVFPVEKKLDQTEIPYKELCNFKDDNGNEMFNMDEGPQSNEVFKTEQNAHLETVNLDEVSDSSSSDEKKIHDDSNQTEKPKPSPERTQPATLLSKSYPWAKKLPNYTAVNDQIKDGVKKWVADKHSEGVDTLSDSQMKVKKRKPFKGFAIDESYYTDSSSSESEKGPSPDFINTVVLPEDDGEDEIDKFLSEIESRKASKPKKADVKQKKPKKVRFSEENVIFEIEPYYNSESESEEEVYSDDFEYEDDFDYDEYALTLDKEFCGEDDVKEPKIDDVKDSEANVKQELDFKEPDHEIDDDNKSDASSSDTKPICSESSGADSLNSFSYVFREENNAKDQDHDKINDGKVDSVNKKISEKNKNSACLVSEGGMSRDQNSEDQNGSVKIVGIDEDNSEKNQRRSTDSSSSLIEGAKADGQVSRDQSGESEDDVKHFKKTRNASCDSVNSSSDGQREEKQTDEQKTGPNDRDEVKNVFAKDTQQESNGGNKLKHGEDNNEIPEEIFPCRNEMNNGNSDSDDDFWNIGIGTGKQDNHDEIKNVSVKDTQQKTNDDIFGSLRNATKHGLVEISNKKHVSIETKMEDQSETHFDNGGIFEIVKDIDELSLIQENPSYASEAMLDEKCEMISKVTKSDTSLKSENNMKECPKKERSPRTSESIKEENKPFDNTDTMQKMLQHEQERFKRNFELPEVADKRCHGMECVDGSANVSPEPNMAKSIELLLGNPLERRSKSSLLAPLENIEKKDTVAKKKRKKIKTKPHDHDEKEETKKGKEKEKPKHGHEEKEKMKEIRKEEKGNEKKDKKARLKKKEAKPIEKKEVKTDQGKNKRFTVEKVEAKELKRKVKRKRVRHDSDSSLDGFEMPEFELAEDYVKQCNEILENEKKKKLLGESS